ncbi:MAG: HAMP domain-containing histidine kinase [Solobacterium sp.]|jgi:signal transduction histidine kinase|nr:HAMP domain-containing histidine kinase [Solobacterium sp.]
MEWKLNRQMSVKKRIFWSNTLMILVTIAISALIVLGAVKLYWEREEQVLMQTLGPMMAGTAAERLVKDLTVHNTLFIVMAAAALTLCVITLVLVSGYFSGSLSREIMKPLNLLEDGAARVKNHDYRIPIVYQGDTEFEQVCGSFNSMQQHLSKEQDRNAKYEKARQEMIAGISHDLRSPLTAIRGSVKAILDGVAKEPEQQKKFLETAERRSEEMDHLLQELFYFSKLETGGIPVSIREIDLTQYVRCYFNALKEEADYQNIVFEMNFPEQSLPPVKADPEALQRILDNVVNNSRKYAKSEPLIFYAETRTGRNGKEQLILQDNGAGVPEEKIGKIFDEFYRADEARSHREGSGLGLYIVKYLMEAMGGRVSADCLSHHDSFHGLAVILEFQEKEAAE